MNHFFLWIGPNLDRPLEGRRLLGQYKTVDEVSPAEGAGWSIISASQRNGLGAFRDDRQKVVRTDGDSSRFFWFGHAWSKTDGAQPAFSVIGQAAGNRTAAQRLKLVREHSDGVFALILIDEPDGKVLVCGDCAGSFQIYYRQFADGIALSNSSALLAGLSPKSGLDPLGAQELCSNAVANEERSIWRSVKKLRAGELLEADCRSAKAERIEHRPLLSVLSSLKDYESAPLPGLFDAISNVLRTIDRSGGRGVDARALPWVADLTGGNDSRALMAAIVANHIHVASTVSGPTSDPDVRIGEHLARQLGIAHFTRPQPDPITPSQFHDALLLTDGEFDSVFYSSVASVHRDHIRDGLQFSLNGSYGELGRGHAWRLGLPGMLLPDLVASRLTSRLPLILENPSIDRWNQYFTLKNPATLFTAETRATSDNYFSGLFSRLMSYAGHLPQHAQLDLIHVDLRMERWQGRLLSSTNQLWPAISPWSFREPLAQLMTIGPNVRRNGLLTRAFTLAYAPVLAREPLYTGNPAMPFSLRNAPRFLPLIPFFANRASEKILSRFQRKAGTTAPTARQRQPHLCADAEISRWLAEPLLAESGLFSRDALSNFLSPDQPQSSRSHQLWSRLLTLEGALRLQAKA
ncbi:MAG: hypothetical protein QM739_00575 [Propionivibrio sp.]